MPIPVGSPLDAGLPVTGPDDVLAKWPERVREAEDAPNRDAIANALAAKFIAYQKAASYSVQQADPTTATGQYLRQHATPVGIFAQEGEDDESLRDRLFAIPEVVTPQAILTLTNSVLARYTSAKAQLCESVLDRVFLFDGELDEECASYIGDGTASLDPDYPDRRYDFRPQRSPTGALPFDDHEGRLFILRVPDIGQAIALAAYPDDGTTDDGDAGTFIGDGADLGAEGTFLFQGGASVNTIYQQLVNAIDAIAGSGVRWSLIVDPKLR